MRNGPQGQVAIRTGPKVTAGAWFIYDPDQGGYYSSGEAEGVKDWRDAGKLEKYGDDE